VAHAAALCGEGDDEGSFRPQQSGLAEGWRRNSGMRVPRSQAVFEALLPTVLAQKVPTDQAHHSYKTIVFELGEPAPGPVRLWVPPPAEVIARMPYWKLHRFNVERRRADVLITAARSAKRLEETAAMDMQSAWARMQAFPGIGPWSAAKVAMIALGDADAVPLGDYHLPHIVGYALEGTARSTDERMLELLEPYRGHRARVIRLLILSGIQAPRFGPRMSLTDITRI
jgi:3-methyladenine DNA glycosylase/8-oxoguanine DNA glycosylase